MALTFLGHGARRYVTGVLLTIAQGSSGKTLPDKCKLDNAAQNDKRGIRKSQLLSAGNTQSAPS